jgi:hypothetical protein
MRATAMLDEGNDMSAVGFTDERGFANVGDLFHLL